MNHAVYVYQTFGPADCPAGVGGRSFMNSHVCKPFIIR